MAERRITAPEFAKVYGKDFADFVEGVAQANTKPKIGMAEAERLERERAAKRKAAQEAEAKRLAEEAEEDEARRYPDR